MRISTIGSVSIAAPTTGGVSATLNLLGANDAWNIDATNNGVTGSSYGIVVTAGTNSTDSSLLVRGKNTSTYLRVRGDGVVLVNRTTSGLTNSSGITMSTSVQVEENGYVFYGNRTASDGLFIGIRRNNVDVGSITVTTSATAFNTSSDYRLKQDLKEFNGLSIINSIKTYDYEWKIDNTRAYGVIAHELEEVLPYAVFGKKDEINENGNIKPQAVDYSKIVPILIKAIQEQQAEIEELKSKIK
jgi:hypothetical protein